MDLNNITNGASDMGVQIIQNTWNNIGQMNGRVCLIMGFIAGFF
jgi:hypothetical protein